MTTLILIAAGGLAREVCDALRAAGRPDALGFLDDDPAKHGGLEHGRPVLGGLAALADHPDADVLICAGRGSTRHTIAQRLQLPSHRYATIVHPAASVGSSCTVGAGSIVLAGCVLTASVVLGQHVVVMPNVTLTHDDRVGDFATLCAGVSLGGSVTVGARAYLGMNAAVRENVTLGADSVIAMGAAVIGDVPPAQTWAGVPAAPLRRLRRGVAS